MIILCAFLMILLLVSVDCIINSLGKKITRRLISLQTKINILKINKVNKDSALLMATKINQPTDLNIVNNWSIDDEIKLRNAILQNSKILSIVFVNGNNYLLRKKIDVRGIKSITINDFRSIKNIEYSYY